MSKQFDELTKNLAKGVSRRSALWRFLTGVSAVTAGAVFSQKKAQAYVPTVNCAQHCAYCYEFNQTLFYECLAVSEACDLVDECAIVNGCVGAPIGLNGSVGSRWTCSSSRYYCGCD